MTTLHNKSDLEDFLITMYDEEYERCVPHHENRFDEGTQYERLVEWSSMFYFNSGEDGYYDNKHVDVDEIWVWYMENGLQDMLDEISNKVFRKCLQNTLYDIVRDKMYKYIKDHLAEEWTAMDKGDEYDADHE